MKFTLNQATNVATSDCGHYSISGALNNGKMWWNAMYQPAQRSLEGSYDKEACKKACEKHAEKMAALKAAS